MDRNAQVTKSSSLRTVVMGETVVELLPLSVAAALRPCMIKLPRPGDAVEDAVVRGADVSKDIVALLKAIVRWSA